VTSPLTYGLLLLIAVCVVLLIRVATGYRGRLARMTQAATHSNSSEEELRALIDQGESDHLEFKSTLRWNLRDNRPGREIEIAWLKTVVAFLNAEGGTLLVGVADDGRIVGHEKDGFKNADKYLLHVNNLIQRHIGVKYVRYLSYDLRPIEGKLVLVIDVLPSDEPCFLQVDEDDQFYVRIGPASRKLSLRKTMEYLKESGR
jgi:predicted HTH transcriptional regulator